MNDSMERHGKGNPHDLTPRQAFMILASWLAVVAAVVFGNSEARDVVRARFHRKTVAQRTASIAIAKPEVVEAAGQIHGDLAILVFKNERSVELHADGWEKPRVYRMTGFNGMLGPKLREGDGQIPEGIYGIEYLNPNSAFHLSLKVSYPGAFDRRHAREDGRRNLGGDIMIHGGSATVGCIPIGDDAIEEVFYFVAKAGMGNTSVIIAPYDMRKGRVAELERSPVPWYGALCDEIARRLSKFPSL